MDSSESPSRARRVRQRSSTATAATGRNAAAAEGLGRIHLDDGGGAMPSAGKPERAVVLARARYANAVTREAAPPPPVRASQTLREILTKNPTLGTFTVRQIVDSIGEGQIATSLMAFSVPAVVALPDTYRLAGLPAGMIAGQMIGGGSRIKLPKFILERSVPRRTLAVAIHAIVPILERVETVAKPRWRWTSHPLVHRLLGVLLFLLALAIAAPMLGFNAPHAAAIFIISFGMVEQDGLAILIGVVAGLASLLLVIAAGFSGKAMRSKAGKWLRNVSRKFALRLAAAFFKKLGYKWAKLLEFEWGQLPLLWDPEAAGARQPAGPPAEGAPPPVARRPKRPARQRSLAQPGRLAEPAPRATRAKVSVSR